MLISDIMNVIVISKKAILDIWNNFDIRNKQKFRIDISTSDNLIIDIRYLHFY